MWHTEKTTYDAPPIQMSPPDGRSKSVAATNVAPRKNPPAKQWTLETDNLDALTQAIYLEKEVLKINEHECTAKETNINGEGS